MIAPKMLIGASALAIATSMVTVAPADATGTSYANCTALHKHWKYGVAKSKSAAVSQYNSGHYTPAYSSAAIADYNRNYKSLDRDKDGTACEVSR